MIRTDTTIIISVDGMEYSLDIANLTGRETGILKRVGKIEGILKIPDAMMAGDMEVTAALTGIAMARAGIKPDYERLLDLPMGAVTTKLPDEDKAGPLAQKPSVTAETAGTLSLPVSTE